MIPSKSIGSEDQHDPGSDCGVTGICARRHRRRTSRSLARRRQHLIKVGPATGSDDLALGTQQVPVGAGIPIHRHFRMDEAFYVLEGSGIFTLNDAQHPFGKGGTIFIPKNAWHGFANPDHELLLLWIMAPPGLDGFFRDTCSPPGVPPKQLTREQVNEIARKYATEFR
jgi:quercetin dioxygenase-like cupin family protein